MIKKISHGKNESAEKDLRKGVRGSLTQPAIPIAGGGSLYALEDPKLATPDFQIPPGQVTHE